MKKVMMIYPPGRMYIRGEERAQPSIDDSSATAMRAANDLAYGSAQLKQNGYLAFVRDYQTEKASLNDLRSDIVNWQPDVLFLSVTNATVLEDLDVVRALKKELNGATIVLKGALFFDPADQLLEKMDAADYLIGGESEFSLLPLLHAHFNDRNLLKNIPGIIFKYPKGHWQKTNFRVWEKNLDTLAFPDRSAIDNSLYVRPDTGEPMATIITSRGCPSKCTFCLTPVISGSEVRMRSPENVYREIEECVTKHNIHNFFFRSDTFTIDPKWTKELCQRIIDSPLHGKIQWVANSRTKPLTRETLTVMKRAGCWLVAFGFESGSDQTLVKIRKGTSTDDNRQAARWCREVGLRVYGFFMMGFPWETLADIEVTRKHMYELRSDFIELHLAFPDYGTELYKQYKALGMEMNAELGKDYFHPPKSNIGIPHDQLIQLRQKILREYHLQPRFIFSKLLEVSLRPKVFFNYARYGIKVLRKPSQSDLHSPSL